MKKISKNLKKEGYSVLLDTNFILDSIRHPDLYYDLHSSLKNNSIPVFTIYPVILEIYKGTDTYSKFQDKIDFVETNISTITEIRTDSDQWDCITQMLLAYRAQGAHASVADIMLAGTLKHFTKSNVVLLTSNYKDFPEKIFDLYDKFIIYEGLTLRTYILVKYSETKFATLINNFTKTK